MNTKLGRRIENIKGEITEINNQVIVTRPIYENANKYAAYLLRRNTQLFKP